MARWPPAKEQPLKGRDVKDIAHIRQHPQSLCFFVSYMKELNLVGAGFFSAEQFQATQYTYACIYALPVFGNYRLWPTCA